MLIIIVDTHAQKLAPRVRRRIDHPLIPFGRGDQIVEGLAKELHSPPEEENT